MLSAMISTMREWPPWLRGRTAQRLLGQDRPRDLLRIVAVVGVYAVFDILTRSVVGAGATPQSFLVGRAVAAHPIGVILLVVLLILVWRFGRGDAFGTWSTIDHGNLLRWLAVPLVVLTAWDLSLYEYNYLVDQWNVLDRLLVAVLAVAVWFRPVALVGFVFVGRIVAAQFVEPLGTTSMENIGELLMIALLVIAAMHVIVAVTGEADSAGVVLVLGAALATHFFVPGVAKMRLGWAEANEPGNFALNAYLSGWMGDGDGSWARTLADAADDLKGVIVIATVVVELCAFVAVYHRRLTLVWLPLWIGFHVGIFAMSGFLFVGWMVLEIALLILLLVPATDDWLARNDTPARGLLGVGLVVGGFALFHPPGLAWIDSPVGYGYEVEAIGESGARYNVALTAFAPFQQDFSLATAEFRGTRSVVGGYGAAGSTQLAEVLADISDFDELAIFEADFTPTSAWRRDRSEELVTRWFDSVNARGDPAWFPVPPPRRFWTSRPNPTYRFQERLQSVTVIQVRGIHTADRSRITRTTVLVVESDVDGNAQVVMRSDD